MRPERETPAWYRDAKFGIMIHWGLYSVPGWAPLDDEVVRLLGAGRTAPEDSSPDDSTRDGSADAVRRSDPLARHSYAEWYQNTYLLDGPTRAYHRRVYGDRPYADFRTEFVAAVRDWDPVPWADLCAAAGARYVVPTSKHHDGYLLWPSAHPNPHLPGWQTGRDVLGELGTAVRDRGLRYGLYYSGGLDWTFGNLPIRRMADVAASVPDSPGYARYVDAHWRELIDRYRPSVLWNDIGYPSAGDADGLVAAYYAAVPDGVVNDRFSRDGADVRTPEYGIRSEIDPEPWETVRALGLSFGWNRQETAEHLLSATELVHLLSDVVSRNGNLLLGITPDDRGVVPAAQRRVLHEVGRWLADHGEAIYGTRPWPVPAAVTSSGVPVRFTRRDDVGYLIVLGDPGPEFGVPGLSLPPGARLRVVGRAAAEPGVTAGPDGPVLAVGPLPPAPAHVFAVRPAS
ncbi:alpha-L-fucosidase [Plantactinospora sp. BB1]|uniref:alpha-L-fucosidase n=1 Tax=Plantactinospora sp. BB1 TaxID=2071627 RepID=UPI000D175A6A|nr:alpha-L-fucosidase [Plantactinospora sp. BB1]AVT37672.1 alpha-L-fucosidase [Plantactinospora sp. BB1]